MDAYVKWMPSTNNDGLTDCRNLAVNGNTAQKALLRTIVPAWQCPTRARTGQEMFTAVDVPGGTSQDGRYGACGDYAVCYGTTDNPRLSDGAFTVQWDYPGLAFSKFTDGLSHTIMAGEKHLPRLHKCGMNNDTGVAYAYSATNGIRWDNTIYAALGSGGWFTSCRAADANGLAQGPMDTSMDSHYFGSWHNAVCPMLMSDGAVVVMSNNIAGSVFQAMGTRAGGEADTSY